MERQGPDLPPYASVKTALLLYLAKRGPCKPADVYGPLAEQFGLTPQQRKVQRNDNSTPLWNNRVQWAREALKKDRHLAPRLRVWELSKEGKAYAALLDDLTL